MAHAHGFDWTAPGRLARADALRAEGMRWVEVAAVLSTEWGETIGEGQVRGAVEHRDRRLKKQRGSDTGVKSARSHGHEIPRPPPPPLDLDDSDVLEVQAPPSSDLPLTDLIADRKRRFALRQKHEQARRLIPVLLRSNESIGILHFGDPHLDDDGCDLSLVEAHSRLVRETPGLYGADVGDNNNFWVGRLAALYAQQTTTAREGWRLLEWFIREVQPRPSDRKWLYLVKGNHDLWCGNGDPLDWIAAGAGVLVQDSEVRVGLRFPNELEVRINCRHSFKGSSIYNPAHGPMRALTFGQRDHIAVCGHFHESAHGELKEPGDGIAMHALKVASYKRFDRYARDNDLPDRAFSPCALTTINPRLSDSHPDLVKIFWDPHEGADYLTFLRSRKAA